MRDIASSSNLRDPWLASSLGGPFRRPMLSLVAETDVDRKGRFAYALRRARVQRGLTPPQLAQRVGVSRGTVNRWEDAQSKDAPSILKLAALSSALGVDPRLFAVLPPEPPSEVDQFLVTEAALRGLEEALATDAQPPAADGDPPGRRGKHREPRTGPDRRSDGPKG